MIKRLLIYLFAILLTFFCLFIYDGAFVSVLLAVEIVYLIAAIIQIFVVKYSVQVEIGELMPIAESGKKVKGALVVKSGRRWSLGKYKAKITILNRFEGKKISFSIRGTTVNGSKEYFEFIPYRCGNYEISIDSFFITDMLGFLKIRKKNNQHYDVGVLPETNLIPLEVSKRTRDYIADADDYSTREAGDDPSEIYQIREYRDGDSLHNIHWKLSAKEDNLMVKEKGKSLGASVLIKLNLESSEESKRLFRKKQNFGNDELLNIMSSLVFSMFDAECICMVSWYDPDTMKVEKMRIYREEDVYYLLNKALYIKNYKKDKYVEVAYEQAFRGVQFSTVVELRDGVSIIVNGEEIKIPRNKGTRSKRGAIAWEQFAITV